MKLSIRLFVLILLIIGINALTDDFDLFSQCDRTISSGVATCLQYFSPIKFVTDFLIGNKESLCCTHFRHTACIEGVRDAAKVAKAANLCPDSISDELISTLTDSTVNTYIRHSCKGFNAGKCVMDSVGDVVNTIQGFFTPQTSQQKPVVPQILQTVPQLFNTNGGQQNIYISDIPYQTNNVKQPKVNSNSEFILNPFREIFNPNPNPNPKPIESLPKPTENPLINYSVRDLYNRQYISEASDIKPITQEVNKTNSSINGPMSTLISGLFNPIQQDLTKSLANNKNPSILDSIGNIFNNNNKQNNSNDYDLTPFLSNIFSDFNDTNNATVVKDINDF
ncbi:uncharacterized protein LOC128959909 [Oppia nitens]|uniref:uncharacterized protein LOC128959909 n=1 Tax=Oppia nitens TaxID=1686743 RepID=UPI0023DA0029|nr:uncharacterized protein LOC128959909 [Oppia nitens]